MLPFNGMKKFDLVNPVIGKLATQVKASKLTDYQVTKKLLEQGEVENLQLRLDALKYGVNKDFQMLMRQLKKNLKPLKKKLKIWMK